LLVLGYTPQHDYGRFETRAANGELLRLEVTVVIVPVDDSALADLFISIALPLYGDETVPPPDRPGSELQQRLLELTLGNGGNGGNGEPHAWDMPQTIPTDGGLRDVDHARELPIAVRSFDPEMLE